MEETKESPAAPEATAPAGAGIDAALEKGAVLNAFIDRGFGAVRAVDWPKFASVGGKYAAAFGTLAFYAFGVVGFIASIVCLCRFRGATGTMLGFAFGILVGGVVAAYVGSKMMTMLDRCVANNRTYVSSSAVLDAVACLLVLVGIGALVVDFRMEMWTNGIVKLVAALLLALAAVCPGIVSVEVKEGTTSGQEFIGLVSFFAKAVLRVVPFVWFAGAAFYTVALLVNLGSKNVDVELAGALAGAMPLAVLPVVAYLGFLALNLLIDIVGAILSIPGKEGKKA